MFGKGNRNRMQSMDASDNQGELGRGRESFSRSTWGAAYAELQAADREHALEPADLERLGIAAYLIGRDGESAEICMRAHQASLARGDIERAVRCCFWRFLQLMNKGDLAEAGGWIARGNRLLEENQLDCVERGYLLVPVALQATFGEEFEAAFETFGAALEIGKRFGDRDLMALARIGRAQTMIGLGKIHDAVSLLDEIMVTLSAGEVSAILAGIIYCGAIDACRQVFDLRRAREWTEALTRWCVMQPDLVPYRGQCLVHRAQILQLRGAWPDAIHEAEQARDQLSKAPDRAAVGMALYELGELHRLRGDLREAESAYRDASQWGHSPQPGLAKLRVAQGRIHDAEAAMRRVLSESSDPMTRGRILPACVEVMLAANDIATARSAADELSELAGQLDAPFLDACAADALGQVFLAEGDAQAAITQLRRAWDIWQQLEAPYEAARARVLIGLACRQLGDEDTAIMELTSAGWALERLGATPDVARVEVLARQDERDKVGGLSGREVEVLAQVATGKTNRQIAEELTLSEKTVARHVSNIFVKLGVSSRAAATAYAYKHDLV